MPPIRLDIGERILDVNIIFSIMGGFLIGGFFASLFGAGAFLGLIITALAGMAIHRVLAMELNATRRAARHTMADRVWARRGGQRPPPPPRRPGRAGPTSLGPFTISLVVLAAKIAKVDGRVTPDAIRAFRRVVNIRPEQEAVIADIFNESKKTAQGFEPYAIRLRDAVHGDPVLLRQVLKCLYDVAGADGPISASEREFLQTVHRIFGLDTRRANHRRGPGEDRAGGTAGDGAGRVQPGSPHDVLGLPPHATVPQIKTAYRELARKHHPDYLQSQGLSQGMIDAAHEEMVRINAAYEQLKTALNFR